MEPPSRSLSPDDQAYMSTEQLRQRNKLAQTYMTEIAHNPFTIETNEQFLNARKEAARIKEKTDIAKKHVPVMDRVNNQARTAYLNLQNQIPGILPQVFGSPTFSKGISSPSLTEQNVTMSSDAAGTSPIDTDLLNRYAPITTNRYANLTEEDQKFLSGIHRRYGPRQKADDYVKQQKEIFLMELNDQTKKREIDQLAYQAKKRDRALTVQQAGLDYQITQLDQQIRTADQGSAQLVQQLESAVNARRRRQEAVDQQQNLLIIQKSELNRLFSEWDKFQGFKKLIEDLLQKIPDETELLRKRQEIQQQVIQNCLQEFKTADGLCLDCLLFKNGANSKNFAPDGWEILEEINEEGDEKGDGSVENVAQSTSRTVSYKNKFRVSSAPCKHKNLIKYEDIYQNPIYDQESKFLNENPDFSDVETVLHDGGQLQVGRSVASEILASIYLRHPNSIETCSIYQLLDSLKHLEQHNFQMVEQIQDLENQKQHLQQQIVKEKIQAQKILQTQNDEINQINVKLQDRSEEKREQKVKEILNYASRAEQQNQQLLQSICEAYILASGLAKEEAQSIGALSQLSQMEQKLESLAIECAKRFTETKQRHFEKACERQRQKQIYQRLKREEEAIRAEKVEKQLEKNKLPLQATDERRVIYSGMFTIPRRPLKSLNKKGGEIQYVDENFYDLQEMEWVEGVGWCVIGAPRGTSDSGDHK